MFSKIRSLALLLLLVIVSVITISPSPVAAQGTYTSPYLTAGALLVLNYSSGTIFLGGTAEAITGSTLTMSASEGTCTPPGYSACNIVYWGGSGGSLSTTTSWATANVAGNIIVGFVATNGTAITTIMHANAVNPQVFQNGGTDGMIFIGPGQCLFTQTSGTAAATFPKLIAPAIHTIAMEASATNAGASASTVDCTVNLSSYLTAGHGVTITDATVAYGVQTTALTSISGPLIDFITLPAPGTSETPSSLPAAACGTLTPTPALASANLGTTTAGEYYSQKIGCGTPAILNTDLTQLTVELVFNQSASAAQIVNVPGVVIHYSYAY